jgi:hypothetical protein
MATPEAIIAGEIRDFLKDTGEFFIRLNSGTIRKGNRFIKLCEVGTPDFIVFRDVPHWIEVKAEGQRTQKERAEKQAAFADKVVKLGHRHIKATTLTEVIEFLDGPKGGK